MQFLWKYVDDLVGKGLDWNVIMQLMFWASFTFVPLAIPLSVLLSSLIAFGNLGERYELVAIKAAGISLRKVMIPLIVFCTLISIGSFYYANIVYPISNLKFRTILWDVRQKKLVLNFKEGIFYSGIPGYVIKIGKKFPEGQSIGEILIYDHTNGQGNKSITIADSGKMENSKGGDFLLLTLFNGYNYDESSTTTNDAKQPFQRTHFDKEVIKFDLSSFKFERTDESLFRNQYTMLNLSQLNKVTDSLKKGLNTKSNELSMQIINSYPAFEQARFTDKVFDSLSEAKYINALDTSRNVKNIPFPYQEAIGNVHNVKSSIEFSSPMIKDQMEMVNRHEIEWHRKFTLAIACLALFLIGAPLGAIIRKGGLGLPLVVSVLLFVAYHVISFSFEKTVRSGATPAWIGMWISTAVFLPVGIYLTYKATTDSPLMDADNYKRLVNRIIIFFHIQPRKQDEDSADL
jgi:lipopolysaccharide export system permease protein